MALADHRGGLAEAVRDARRALASLIKNPRYSAACTAWRGIIKPMNSLGKTTYSSVPPASSGKASIPPLLPPTDDEIARLAGIIRTQEIKIQALIQEVAYLRRIRYGVKSEAMSAEQRQLFEDDIVQDVAAVESELKLPTTPAAPRSRAGRQALPEHLERVDVRHEPDSCTCQTCQANLVKIGEDVSEQLDIEPARFFVIRHIRPQYACRQCESVTAAPVAPLRSSTAR